MNYRIVDTLNVSRECMVCGIDNPWGLRSRFYVADTGEVIALFTPEWHHQSYPQILHGGITAAVLDETIGRAIMPRADSRTFGVTVDLSVQYKRPVPYGIQLTAVGRITNQKGRIFEGSGELYLPDGSVAATARGKYLRRPLDLFTDPTFIDRDWFKPDDFPAEIIISDGGGEGG